MDFTLKKYRQLLSALLDQGRFFKTFEEFLIPGTNEGIVLRHDVDRIPVNALKMSAIERGLDIRASYHFRYPGNHNEKDIIRQIVSDGHEIAYHYEETDLVTKGSSELVRRMTGMISHREPVIEDELIMHLEKAYLLFVRHLEAMREFYPVKVISMHGSPLSLYDNRDVWKFHSYKDLGIICEVYLDIDYSKVLYLTDTGRRWDGDRFNIRDRPLTGLGLNFYPPLSASYTFSSTTDIINACRNNLLPSRIVLNTHPQRWNDNMIKWLAEGLKQRTKNLIKGSLVKHKQHAES